jgi:hypothetical protein
VNVHVRVLRPPLEQAPDQIASRPFETLSVIDVPVANDAEPVAPTAVLMPAGFEVTRPPLLPLAVTVSVAVWPDVGGFTVTVAVRVTPPKVAVIVADVATVTDVVEIVKFAVVAPPGTVTFAGTVIALEFSDRATTVPPLGAAALKVTVPVEALPPITLDGLADRAASVGPVAPGGLIPSVALCVTF